MQRLCMHEPLPTPLSGDLIMLAWALVFLVVAIIAAILGFGGAATTAATIAQILFFVFLVLFILGLIFSFARGTRVP